MKVKINNRDFNVENDEPFWNQIDVWENHSFKILDHFLNNKNCLIDVGAWNGVLSIYASRICRNVIAFEPDTAAFSNLTRNIELNDIKNIECHNIGLSDKDESIPLNIIRGGDSMSSIIDRTMQHYTKNSVETIKTILLSKFLIENKVSNIGLIKIDTEGAEIFIIPEIQKYLTKHKPTLYLSFHPNWFPEKDIQINNLIDILSEIYNIFSTSLNPVTKEQTIFGLYNNSHEYLFIAK